ncbi:MAG TPA: selenium cofactor biosynthesis protein YqeC [Candidatus Binatia bacterium]|nr:selenium cofactor biosynthesis protein YqeC [Candidatus Binatia bacterium]
MRLADSLGVKAGEMVSLIGAGGKTTTLFRLARELRDAGGKILVTTTTKIFKPTKPHVDRLFLAHDAEALIAEVANIPRPAVIGAGYGVDDEDKLLGLPTPWLDDIKESAELDAVLVEADGAASRLFKVPSELEPVVPKLSNLVIWSMAIKIVGKPLDANSVHRAERALALLSVPPGTLVTPEHILKLVAHPDGCLRGLPAASRKVALLNQADTPDELAAAQLLARALTPLGFERAVITSFLSDEAVKT